jgi:hypothetical protein
MTLYLEQAMRCGGILKVLSVVTVLLVGAVFAPRTAEAQARGTVQASATVVDTRTSFASLEAARNALRPASAQQRVATVAQVTVQRPEERPTAVVITIDYSRN